MQSYNTTIQVFIHIKHDQTVRRDGKKYTEGGKYKLRSNREIYTNNEENKRRVVFYRHIKNMNEGRLIYRLFTYFDGHHKTLQRHGSDEEVERRDVFSEEIEGFKGFQERKNQKTGVTCTGERKK